MLAFERTQRVIRLCKLLLIHLQSGQGESGRRTACFIMPARKAQVVVTTVRISLSVRSLRRAQVIDQGRL